MKRLLILAILLLLAGCVEITLTHEIQPDASSEVHLLYDISSLEQLQGLDTSEEEELEVVEQNPCEEFVNSTYSCEQLSDTEILLTTTWQVPEERLTIQQGLLKTTYELDVRAGIDLLELVDEDEPLELAMLKQIGGEIMYEVTLPGKITDAPTGQIISEDTVRVDLLSISENHPTIITSAEQKNTFLYGLYGLGGVLLVLLFFVALTRLKKHDQEQATSTRTPQEPHTKKLSANERRYKEYIEQYRSDYSREALQEVLTKANLPTQQVNEYLDKYY